MKGNYLKICEVFDSISGEGLRAGLPATFIRFSGCDLNCDYCDTKYHKDNFYKVNMNEINGVDDDEEKLIDNYNKFTNQIKGKKFVILTGGEPCIQNIFQLHRLMRYLYDHGTVSVEIETNSTTLNSFIEEFQHSCMSIHYSADFKLNCKDELSYCLEALTGFQKLNLDDCIKVVVSDYADIEKAVELANKYTNTNVIVSPCYGAISPTDVAEYLIKCRYQNVRMQIQLHKVLWEADKRGV